MAPLIDTRGRIAVLIAYYLTVALHVLGALYPHARLWAFHWWAYQPPAAQIAALVVALMSPWPLLYLERRLRTTGQAAADSGDTCYQWWAVGLTIGLAALFVIFHSRTHFLGDGYVLLSLHNKTQPLLKVRGIGESLLHIWLNRLLSGGVYDHALSAFRLISYAAGVLYSGVVLITARKIYKNSLDRWLFATGMLTGGWALLFFGYVELYSMLTVALTSFLLVSLLAIDGKLSVWWSVLTLGVSAFMHIMAATLLPALIYLLLRRTRLGAILRQMKSTHRWLIGALTVCIGFVTLLLWQRHDLPLKLALVPLQSHYLSFGNYTLFSLDHMADYLELLILLIPGILVAFATLAFDRTGFLTPRRLFLAIASACTAGAAFVFDPKLGMPRDWDLFAFAGISLSLLFLTYLIERHRVFAAIVLTAVGVQVLAARVTAQATPAVMEAHYRDYLELDPARSYPSGVGILRDYLLDEGDTTSARDLMADWKRRYPEYDRLDKVNDLIWHRRTEEAMRILRDVQAINPRYFSLWHLKGIVYTQQGKLDSALESLRIADALNPYSAATALALSNVYLMKADTVTTRQYLRAAWERDSTAIQSVLRRNPPLKKLFDGHG